MAKLKKWHDLDKSTKNAWRTTIFWLTMCACVIICAILVSVGFSNKLPHHYTVRGESMIPTLQDSQVVTLQHDDTPIQKNDIVVFTPPSQWMPGKQKEIIKRVIATPGDQVDLIRGIEYGGLWVNEEKSVEIPLDYTCKNGGESFKVPDGMILVVGDNVSNSSDSLSRMCDNAEVYLVPIDNVLDYGQVEVVK